jgi:putative addiction module component (TIGR02574 family)
MNKTLLEEAMQLSPAERIELVQDIWDSIADRDFPPLTAEQEREIERRMAEHDKDPSRTSSWEEVRKRIRSRLK